MLMPCSNIGQQGKLPGRSHFDSRRPPTLLSSVPGPLSGVTALVVTALVVPRMEGKGTLMGLEVDRHREVTANSKEMVRNQKPNQVQVR